MTQQSQNFGSNPYFTYPQSHSSHAVNIPISIPAQKPQDIYSLNSTYPPIKVKEKNPLYAREMLSNIGGQNSELTAIISYFYSHMVLEKYPNISKAFHFISIIEMKHLEIFGELSIKLGADPRLWERQRRGMVYWNAGYVNYVSKNPKNVLQNALGGELEAIEKYTRQIKIINDENIQTILKRVIEDEKIHVELFRKFLAEIKQQENKIIVN